MITSNASLNKAKQSRSKIERTLALLRCWVGVMILLAVYMVGSFVLRLLEAAGVLL